MNRIIVTALALITGLFALIFSLLMAIPLTIAALITGKRIEARKKYMQREMQEEYEFNTGKADAIEGEFEEVHR
ncbi:hypothetical protein [Vibrio sp. B1FLJ16]|uniref:hypothetical protein n=1 Tax=Vibrio sp. B1FLJ16 TaxID=2751178 RepID=UPI0015F6612F|nr:hypothetical protein [Vibrio sp. B1FLJ16]CAD7821339.1 hypothetical protein ACOMICROBIO_EPCKBFOG_04039 [Vibrio sp. B1FLJ16]CAD7822849.1 hypothetical protein ACOMICROBIO_FLGHMIGD_03066 [Vibrio sp. B1FLJ16]CAE6945975.1 hypothetical protein ACOMICROBIO_EPCKBFOG_04039 [Vibrio sp. B1FLJ16]CAE6950218.1 hypothetical protein ACOMICROBIO_FLGHMIGD_03066 [Vibrio sp. B1FLJ16]